MSVLMFLCVARMGNAAHAKARDPESQNARKRDFFGSQDAPLEISVSWFKWRVQHWGSRVPFAGVWEPNPLLSWIRARFPSGDFEGSWRLDSIRLNSLNFD